MEYVGLALSNGLVGLAGALFTMSNSFADVTSGVGTIVVGLAAVILGQPCCQDDNSGWLSLLLFSVLFFIGWL